MKVRYLNAVEVTFQTEYDVMGKARWLGPGFNVEIDLDQEIDELSEGDLNDIRAAIVEVKRLYRAARAVETEIRQE